MALDQKENKATHRRFTVRYRYLATGGSELITVVCQDHDELVETLRQWNEKGKDKWIYTEEKT